jgi:hypothetical protein
MKLRTQKLETAAVNRSGDMGVVSRRAALAAVGMLVLAGCGGGEVDDRPKAVRATGVVTYAQAPVEGASVVFIPQGQTAAAAGVTGPDGRFELQTYTAGDGAVPGEYKVTVTKFDGVTAAVPGDDTDEARDDESEDLPEPVSLLPEKYAVPATSDLEATVVDGIENEFTFDLED